MSIFPPQTILSAWKERQAVSACASGNHQLKIYPDVPADSLGRVLTPTISALPSEGKVKRSDLVVARWLGLHDGKMRVCFPKVLQNELSFSGVLSTNQAAVLVSI